MENIEKINGYEIIDYLNEVSVESEELQDTNICSKSFVFESQELKNGIYKLHFTTSYNNWGTNQPISGNEIVVNKKGVKVNFCEPFEGDGTDEVVETIISNWIETFEFKENLEEIFITTLRSAYEQLPEIAFDNKKELQQVIDKLIKAQTYQK